MDPHSSTDSPGDSLIPKRHTSTLWAICGIGLLFITFYPAISGHLHNATDPLTLNDDARQQVWPFLRYHTNTLSQTDYIAEYYLSCMPLGHWLIYRGTSAVMDPRLLGKILPYPLLAITIIAAATTSKKLGGTAAAYATVALCLASSIFLDRMTGGLPRCFGFPLMACGAAALAWGRPIALAAIVCLSAAFYPAAGVLLGAALAIQLLVLPRRDRGNAQDWPLTKRLALPVVTAVLCVVILLPTLIGSSAYNPLIQPHQIDRFPEAGPGGRYMPGDRAPAPPFIQSVAKASLKTLISPDRTTNKKLGA